MNIEFQEEVLRFCLQNKEGKKGAEILDVSVFDVPEVGVVFELWRDYLKEYKTQPSKVSLQEFWRRTVDSNKQKVETSVFKQVNATIRKLYEPSLSDTSLIRKTLVEFAKRKRTKNMFKENADLIAKGDDSLFSRLYREMAEINKLGADDGDEANNKGGFLLADHSDRVVMIEEGHPFFLKGVNKMTAARGFHKPMLVVLLGAPKAFKTGFLIKAAVEYMRDGLKVYYADTENGISSIKARANMAMLECERRELKENKEVLNKVVKQFRHMGGDMVVDFYPANSKTLDDVDANLQVLWEEHGWRPDVIILDYIDLFKSTDKTIKDKRLIIQDIYYHAVRLNNKWGMFNITVSPVNRKAVNKEIITMQDFGEDFAKAYNCHAAFARCQTPEEQQMKVARVIPVAQREGVQFAGTHTCTVHITHERMMIEEVDQQDIIKKAKRDKNLKDE